jgi:hypothetical protein
LAASLWHPSLDAGLFEPPLDFVARCSLVASQIGNSASTGETGPLGQGLDVRGDGGYIIAPPSLHISGRQYTIAKGGHPDEVELRDNWQNT